MHKAIIAKITETTPIPGADRIHVAKVLGESVIVSKEWKEGMVGVLFPVDLQLSEEFCYHNNLFRDSEKNKDKTKKGFFENNRRVRAQPFLKVKSEGFFADLSCLDYLGGIPDPSVGTTFDTINGKKVCEKYISEQAKIAKGNNSVKAAKKSYAPLFEKHVDSEQFRHYAESIQKGSILYFHHKVHGTSHRQSYTLVDAELPKWKQLVNKVVKIFPEQKWEHVVGTRNVVLRDKSKEGHHGSEQFRFDVAETIKPYLEKGMTVYGEIAGFANGRPIMPDHNIKNLKDKRYTKKYGDVVRYTYGCKEHEARFHVYRITYLNHAGKSVDMTQAQMEKWCKDRGILTTLEVHPPIIYDGDVDKLRELVDTLTEREDVLTEDYLDPSHISEGIIIREENGALTPKFYKSKSHAFRVCEGHVEVADEETIN